MSHLRNRTTSRLSARRRHRAVVLLGVPGLALTLYGCGGNDPATPGAVQSAAASVASQAASAGASVASQAASAGASVASQAASAGASVASQAASAGTSAASSAASAVPTPTAGTPVASPTASVSPTTSPPATGASTGTTGTTPQITVNGRPLLPLAAGQAGNLAAQDGARVQARGVAVQSVPADEGFWLGSGENDRVWVQLVGSGESNVQVQAGDRVQFSGVLERHDASFVERTGITAAEGRNVLRQQGAHIEVQKDELQLAS